MAGGRAGPGPGRPARDVHLDATNAGPPGTRTGRGARLIAAPRNA